MEIFFDNLPVKETNAGTDLVWDDDMEMFFSFRGNTLDGQTKYPAAVMCTTYEMIQFIELYLDAPAALEFLRDNMDDEKQIDKGKQLIRNVTGHPTAANFSLFPKETGKPNTPNKPTEDDGETK